jgi:nitrogenase-associated protein
VSVVIFYEKPGCITNGKQRRLLEAAGHTLIVRNLLTEPWDAGRLRGFFGDAAVVNWFNPVAPAIKAGLVDPAGMTEAAALTAMLHDPLLIRRPLLDIDGICSAGFDPVALGLDRGATEHDPEACSRPTKGQSCPPATAARNG